MEANNITSAGLSIEGSPLANALFSHIREYYAKDDIEKVEGSKEDNNKDFKEGSD